MHFDFSSTLNDLKLFAYFMNIYIMVGIYFLLFFWEIQMTSRHSEIDCIYPEIAYIFRQTQTTDTMRTANDTTTNIQPFERYRRTHIHEEATLINDSYCFFVTLLWWMRCILCVRLSAYIFNAILEISQLSRNV